MEYRRDIDGLRAIAVLPVVIYHISQSYMPGGYVGVDVFFVISGYLIGTNIINDLDRGRFSLLDFYRRRIRRIFPAYAVLLAIVSAVILIRYFASEVESYGASVLSSVASVSNIYFWAKTNYFGVEAEEIPLLHTWSLSVEEQFYLLFPLLMMFVFRFRKTYWQGILIVVFVVSLVASIVSVYSYPSATFYLLWSRAWELLFGVLCGALKLPAMERRWQRDVTQAVGLLLIAVPMLFYRPYTTFPGIAAVPPCLGAAICLYVGARGNNMFSPLLKWRPMVFFGLISYSLYLWHWPLLVFQRTEFFLAGSGSRLVDRGAILAASICCATLSWALVERPTRNPNILPVRPLVAGFFASVAFLSVLGFSLVYFQGFPGRFGAEAQNVARYLDYNSDKQFRAGTCFLAREDGFARFDHAGCLPNLPGRPTYLVFGDSHAAAMSYGIRQVLADANILQVSGVGCPAEVVLQDASSDACRDLIDLALNKIPATHNLQGVFLVSRWNLGRIGRGPGWNPTWLEELAQTVKAFEQKGIKVTVVGPMPEYQVRLPRILARSLQNGDPTLPGQYLRTESLELDSVMHEFADREHVSYISVKDALCPAGKCETFAAPDTPMLFDTDHLTDAGSVFVARKVASALTAGSKAQ